MREFLLDCPQCGELTSIVIPAGAPRPERCPRCGASYPGRLQARIRSLEVPDHLSARAWFEMRRDEEFAALMEAPVLPPAVVLDLTPRLRALGGVIQTTPNGQQARFPLIFRVPPRDATPEELVEIWTEIRSAGGSLEERLALLPVRWGEEGVRLLAATREQFSLPELALILSLFGGEKLADALALPPEIYAVLEDRSPELTAPAEVRTLLKALSPPGPLQLWPEETRRLGNRLRQRVREDWDHHRQQQATGPEPGDDDLGRALTAAGYTRWRSQEQRAAAELVLSGQDGIVVLPTGSGKTLCYTLPAQLLAADEGYTLVVSPLLALMADQVRREEGAIRFRGGMTDDELEDAFDALDQTHLAFISPELLLSQSFRERLVSWRAPTRLVIDEAHCVLQWGESFRSDYLKLGQMRRWLEHHEQQSIPMVAFSATLTPPDIAELKDRLDLNDPQLIQGSADRPELCYAAFQMPVTQRPKWLLKFLQRNPVSRGLAYVSFARGKSLLSAENVAMSLREAGIAADYFHSKLSRQHKERVVEALRSGELQVVVATSAFGMGVDLPWLDWVIHLTPTTRLSEYLQGAGRAGRNMDPEVEQALCVLLARTTDKQMLSQHLYGSLPRADTIQDISDNLTKQRQKQMFFSWDEETGLLSIDPQRDVARSGALAYAARRGGIVRRKDVEHTLSGLEQVYELPVDPVRMAAFNRAREDDRREVDRAWRKVMLYLSTRGCLRELMLQEFGSELKTEARCCCIYCDRELLEAEFLD
jgi:ATP-dependent DNA helicase RecQ